MHFVQEKPRVSRDHLSEQRSWLLSSMITQHRFVVRLRTYLFIMYFLLHILLSQFFDTWLNPKCPPGAFALHYSSGSQFCFCVSACGAAAFNFVPEAIQHSASCRKCSGSVSDRSWRNLHGELHGSTRQELPAQTAEYSQMVKTCCHINKVTRTKVPIGSVDHHFSSAWSVSWQHFLLPTLYIVTFKALCWLLSEFLVEKG